MEKSDIIMDSCMHCLSFHHNWTKYDALTNMWIKLYNENGLFLNIENTKKLPCMYCKPRQHISPDIWNGTKNYYKLRGIK